MAWGTGSPMPDGVRAADALDGPEPEVTSAEHRLLRRVRINLSLWSGGITLAVLVVLGIILFVAVEQSLAASGTAQLEARADQVTRQRPDPDDLPQAGINFGGVGSGTLLVLATEDGQPIVLPGPNRDGPPPGLPLMEGIDAVKAGVERDIRTASITTTDGTETITTPIRVLTEGATLQGQPPAQRWMHQPLLLQQHLARDGGVPDEGAHFRVQRGGARVEVEGAHERQQPVHHQRLGMQRRAAARSEQARALVIAARLQLIEVDAGAQQGTAIAHVAAMDRDDIGGGERIGHDAHLHPALHHPRQQRHPWFARHEIG